MLNFIRKSIGINPSVPPPLTAEDSALQEQALQKYLVDAYKWLGNPLSKSFVLSKEEEDFSIQADRLLNLIYRFSPQNLAQVRKVSELLLRRYAFSFYYLQYHANPPLAAQIKIATEKELMDLKNSIHDEAHRQSSQLNHEFVQILSHLAKRDISQEVSVDVGRVCDSVCAEMMSVGLYPEFAIQTVPQVKQAPTPQRPPMPQAIAQPVKIQPPVAMNEEKSLDQIMSQNTLAPESLTQVEFSGGLEDPDSCLHRVGRSLENILNEKLNGNVPDDKRLKLISYQKKDSTGSRICYGRMVFQLDRKIDSATITDRMMNHTLSLAGFEPDTTPYQIRALAGGKIAIDLPVYVDTDPEANYLIKYIISETNSEPLLRSRRDKEVHDIWKQYLRSLILSPSGELRFLAGISASGEPILLKVIGRTGAGMAITGKSGCGKSGQILSFANQVELALTPEEVQFVAMDFKGEAQTLQLIADSPHLWCPPSYSEWMQTAQDHGLAASSSDFAKLWDEADLALPSVIWKKDDAIAVMAALEREKSRRAAILAKHKLQNVFEYNDWIKAKKPPSLKPMPLMPILLEEGGGYAREIGAGAACTNVHEITSQWRAFGMFLIITVQDGKADTALPPSARVNFVTKYLFLSDNLNATRLLGEDSIAKKWVAIASRLLPQVDAIAYSDGGYFHIHPFYLGTEHVKWIVKLSCSIYREWCDRRKARIESSAVKSISPLEEILALPVVEEEVIETATKVNEDEVRYQKLMAFLDYNNRAEKGEATGKQKMTTNQVLIELVGKCKYSDPVKFPKGEETVLNGTNRDRAIRDLQELALRFGTSLKDEEIRKMQRVAS